MKYFPFKVYIKITHYAFKQIIRYLVAYITGGVKGISIYKHKEVKRKKIYSSSEFNMPSIKDIDGKQKFSSYQTIVPEANIFEIKNGIFFPGREEIFTSDFKVLKEITVQKNNIKIGINKKKLSEYNFLKGKVLCLSISGVERNYYHFNVEFLTRWHLFKASKLDYDFVDFDEKNNFQKQFIKLLGIPKNKLIPLSLRTKAIKADALIVPSLGSDWKYFTMPRGKLHYMKRYSPIWFKKVHENFRTKSKKFDKIYVSRSKASRRRISNEKDTIELIKRYGFKIIYLEDFSVKDQISIFNSAKIIVALHGAGIVNIVYCSKPFRLLEIYPQNYLDSSFRILAQVLDCDYHCLIGEAKKISNIDPQKENVHIDCKKLEKWLNKFASIDGIIKNENLS